MGMGWNTERRCDDKYNHSGGATVESESGSDPAIGADVGNVTIVIKDNAHITKATTRSDIDYVAIGGTGYSATQCNEK